MTWPQLHPPQKFLDMPYLRSPNKEELEFFKTRGDVPAMMTDDEHVVFNPYVQLTNEAKQSLYKNESSRIAMRRSQNRPNFELTDEQNKTFKDKLNYSPNDQDIRETIVARILSDDPSSGIPTQQQLGYANQLGNQMRKTYR